MNYHLSLYSEEDISLWGFYWELFSSVCPDGDVYVGIDNPHSISEKRYRAIIRSYYRDEDDLIDLVRELTFACKARTILLFQLQGGGENNDLSFGKLVYHYDPIVEQNR